MEYTPQEAANILGFSKKTVLKRIKDGVLPCFKLGTRTYRIDEKDIKAYKEKCKTSNPKIKASIEKVLGRSRARKDD